MGEKFVCVVILCLILATIVDAQESSQNELQANLSGYADNFGVVVIYPNFSLTRQVNEATSINGRFLVDAVSSASMKSHFEVDGVSSATSKTNGGGDNTPDELRFQFGGGAQHSFGSQSAALNMMYSTEHDYSSLTFAGNFIQPMAQKNTTFHLGFVRSMDKVFPQIRDWKRDVDVATYSVQATQNLTPRAVMETIYSYTTSQGHLSDNYQVVTVTTPTNVLSREPVHPDSRIRQAAAARLNYYIFTNSSVQFGYRYYWDDWEVNGHTISTLYQTHLGEDKIMGIGVRTHKQSKAFFYQETYNGNEQYMTVDPKLKEATTLDIQFKISFPKVPIFTWFPVDDRLKYQFAFNWYRRNTTTPDWHSKRNTLYAYNFNIGIRYRY
ncbi:DUF3570 domain-containing protein [candidate division KSB1 bacterium]|nr:DUF3570 domain-containing protein [candidate division KSB1 bacterium]